MYRVAFAVGQEAFNGIPPVAYGGLGITGAGTVVLAYGAGAPGVVGMPVLVGKPDTLEVVVLPMVSIISPIEMNAV